MASEDVELVRRGFDAFNEGGVEDVLPTIADGFVMTTPPELASEPDTYRGHDGLRRYFDSFYEAMDQIRWEAHEFRDLGRGRVAVDFTLHARGRSSGLDFGLRAIQVWVIADGKAVEVRLYTGWDQLEADSS